MKNNNINDLLCGRDVPIFYRLPHRHISIETDCQQIVYGGCGEKHVQRQPKLAPRAAKHPG